MNWLKKKFQIWLEVPETTKPFWTLCFLGQDDNIPPFTSKLYEKGVDEVMVFPRFYKIPIPDITVTGFDVLPKVCEMKTYVYVHRSYSSRTIFYREAIE